MDSLIKQVLYEARHKLWAQDDELKLSRARLQMFDDMMKVLYSSTPSRTMQGAEHPTIEGKMSAIIDQIEKKEQQQPQAETKPLDQTGPGMVEPG